MEIIQKVKNPKKYNRILCINCKEIFYADKDGLKYLDALSSIHYKSWIETICPMCGKLSLLYLPESR